MFHTFSPQFIAENKEYLDDILRDIRFNILYGVGVYTLIAIISWFFGII